MKKFFIVLLAMLCLCSASVAEEVAPPITLRFSEVMASNHDYLLLPNDMTPDWLELENYGDQPIQLDGLWLSDSKRVLNKFIFPEGTTLEPGEMISLYAAGVEGEINGVMCTAFKLSADGETVIMYLDGVRVDELKYPALETNEAYALDENGTFRRTSTPTIGEKNVITEPED